MLDWMSRPVCVFLAAVALALPRTVRAVDIIGGPVTNAASGHIYYLLAESTWLEAEEEAGRLGGHLASINSQAEQDWIIQTFNSLGGNTNRNFLIGLNDRQTEGQFVWASGEPVTYTNWRPGEPNDAGGDEDCTEIILANADELGQWNDLRDAVFQQGGGQVTEHGVVEVLPRHEWIKWLASAGGNDHFYALTTTAYTNWFDAEAEASLFGGHLVSISSAEEQRFIEDTFLGGTTASNVFYTGLNDLVSEGVYVWSSGESLTYTNWNSGEPNNLGDEDAVVVNYHYRLSLGPRGSWNDTSAYGSWYRGIIEAPTVASVFIRMTNAIPEKSYQALGCAWGDYNADGWLDLYVCTEGFGANLLYRNNGGATFESITNVTTTAPTGGCGCAWGDLDNDGWLDLFIASRFTNNFLFKNTGNEVFVQVPLGNLGFQGDQRGCAWADYDNDTFLDIISVGQSGPAVLMRNLQGNAFVGVSSGGIPSDMPGIGVSWADYDCDGDLDLYIAREGPNSLFRNEGYGQFTKITTDLAVADAARSWACAWGDYNNDTFPDLFVVNRGQPSVLFTNDKGAGFKHTSFPSITADSVACGWADYDCDGFLDILVVGNTEGQHMLCHNEGDGAFVDRTPAVIAQAGPAHGCTWGDFDNDGWLDLFLSPYSRQGPLLLNNVGNGNHWLKLQLVGVHSNRPAIGTSVKAKARIGGFERWQSREVSGGGGFCSQDALDVHFGLGDATSVDVLRIEWPSGMVQEFLDVRANQTLIICEPPLLEIRAIQPFRSVETILTSRGGFDYAIEATEDFRQWARIGTLTRVNGSVQFVDQSAGLHRQRFYRAAMVP